MSYSHEQHLKAERSRKVSRSKISTFRRDRKTFIKYGKRRVQAYLDDFRDGEYITQTENGRTTGVRSYIE